MASVEIAWMALALLAAASLSAYGLFGERGRIGVTRHEIRSPRIPEAFDGRTILQFSDTHIGPYYSLDRLKRLTVEINALEPDIVVFTGDLHDAGRRDTLGRYDPAPILAEIEARLGKYAVYGNHDFGFARNLRSSGSFLARGGFSVLLNSVALVSLPGGESIAIAGLDDYVLGRPDAANTLSGLQGERFHILLAHEPDVADRLIRYPIDLQLSGHSHGGQVSLPFIGPLVTTPLGRKYIKGMHLIGERSRKNRPYVLYVNRGIGTTRLPLRLGSVPELSLFTLRHDK